MVCSQDACRFNISQVAICEADVHQLFKSIISAFHVINKLIFTYWIFHKQLNYYNMYATCLCVYNKHIVIYINITLHVNNKTVFQIHENNNKYILVFIKYYKLQWIMVVNINGGHIVELGVDKSTLLFFTATTGVMPFAKLFCNCLMIALTSLISC